MNEIEPVEIGVITGVGQAGALRELPTLTVETPYGPPSMPIRIGRVGGRRVAVLTRRGDGEVLQPHLVPNRANVWALASLGARVLISSTASSGLREAFSPGTYVVPDQILDLTHGRDHTFHDHGDAVQLASADPFDSTLRALLVEVVGGLDVRVRDYGTVAVTDGPRFPTVAEANWYRAGGADLANQTLMPETALARELGLGVVNLSFITDWAPGQTTDRFQTSSSELIARRSSQASAMLVQALGLLVSRVPAGYQPASEVTAEQVRALLRPDGAVPIS